jgi:hypothetical protein
MLILILIILLIYYLLYINLLFSEDMMLVGRYRNKLHTFNSKILFRNFSLKGAFIHHHCVHFLLFVNLFAELYYL